MVKLVLKNGKELSYDEVEDKVYVDGRPNVSWTPAFIPNGDDEPTFFGFVNKAEGKCYDIFGGVSKISNEDDLKL